MLYLDITRIFQRADAPTPTGIDRVEFEYAKYFLQTNRFFVVQFGDRLQEVPFWLVEILLNHLTNNWKSGSKNNTSIFNPHAALLAIESWKNALNFPKTNSKLEGFFLKLRRLKLRDRFAAIYEQHEFLQANFSYAPPFLVALLGALFFRQAEKFILKDFFSASDSLRISPTFKKIVYINVGHTGLEKDKLLSSIASNDAVFTLIYLHDILPISHPELFTKGSDLSHKARLENVEKYSDAVVVNSHFTKRQIEKFYPKILVDTVAEIGLSFQENIRPVSAKNRSGFVAIGTVEPRKNYLWLVRKWLSFVQKYPNLVQNEKLTIFGASGWLNGVEITELNQMVDNSDHVEIISGASDNMILSQLVKSRAYVSAAKVEGWGMPLAESLSCGTPVIASEIFAHREVTKGNCSFFELNDESDFSDKLMRHYEDSELQSLIDATTLFEAWSWPDHFAKIENHIPQSPLRRGNLSENN